MSKQTAERGGGGLRHAYTCNAIEKFTSLQYITGKLLIKIIIFPKMSGNLLLGLKVGRFLGR
jgi:hypothetical protein